MKRRNPKRAKRKLSERRNPKPAAAAPGAPPVMSAADVDALNATLQEAVQLQQAGRLTEAAAKYRAVLDAVPGQTDALHMLAIITHQLGNSAEAVGLFEEAITTRPDDPEMRNNLGIILNESGRAEDAIAHFDRALQINPGFPEAVNNHANALRNLDRLEEARDGFLRAIELAPGYAQAYSNLGTALIDLGDAARAKTALEKAVELDPNHPGAWSNLGAALQDLGEFDAALEVLDKALALQPDNAQALNNKGHVLQELDRFEAAEPLFRRAIAIQPDYADAYINLGLTQQMQNHPADAIATLREGIRHFPENPDLHWNLALALLQSGDYAEGWREYEWRWRMPKFSVFHREVAAPAWRGEDMAGKRLFVHAEQGLGDTLNFARYLPGIAAQGVEVVFECAKPLAPLFRASPAFAGIEVVTEAPGACDGHAPLLSLPGIVGTTVDSIPADIPYLAAPTEKIDAWAGRAGGGFKVGLVWAGSAIYQNDFRRSLPFDLVDALLETPGADFHALQVERLDAAADAIASGRLTDIGTGFSDFADTAGAVANLDLVISVDTSVAHLAGAMGKPVWTLLPKASDWRWLLGREDTPWYPTMRLFRQSEAGEWQRVMDRVAAALAETLAA